MPVSMDELLADLSAETADLDSMLSSLSDAQWELPTPAAGWAIRDQISHLAYFDDAAVLALVDPRRFRAEAAELASSGPGVPDRIASRYRTMSPTQLLAWFRRARTTLIDRFASASSGSRLPWYGPDMSAVSSATARLMETWAHGQDVADALDLQRAPTARLRHVAHLGVRTFAFSFTLRGRAVPEQPVHVALQAPDGSTWSWGPSDAQDVVRGPAVDFCLVVTQRRHLDDTTLQVAGPVALHWMSIAQAFAGAPGAGRTSSRSVAPPSEEGST